MRLHDAGYASKLKIHCAKFHMIYVKNFIIILYCFTKHIVLRTTCEVTFIFNTDVRRIAFKDNQFLLWIFLLLKYFILRIAIYFIYIYKHTLQ